MRKGKDSRNMDYYNRKIWVSCRLCLRTYGRFNHMTETYTHTLFFSSVCRRLFVPLSYFAISLITILFRALTSFHLSNDICLIKIILGVFFSFKNDIKYPHHSLELLRISMILIIVLLFVEYLRALIFVSRASDEY